MIDFGYKVTLDTLDVEDLEKFRKARNNYSIWKWCRQPTLLNADRHFEWFENQSKDTSIKMFAVKDRTEHVVGVCGLTSMDTLNRRAEFSLYIFPEEQKKGYAKAALSTLLSHAFRDLNMHIVWGETFDQNPAYKMFRSLGFVHEGTRRDFYFKDGRYIDAHLVSIKETEWNSPQRSSHSQV